MDDLYARGFVLRDSLEVAERYDRSLQELQSVSIRGRIVCRDGVVIVVRKALDVRRGRANRYDVRGIDYVYHAWVRSRPRRDLFRFDNAHGNITTLHRHVFDEKGAETATVPVSYDDLPRLDLIIETAVSMVQTT